MYQCAHCGHMTLVWQNDYDLEDVGYEGTGIVTMYHCAHCGADVEYVIRFEEEE